MLARKYFISGDVQGVGFRYFVLREAQRIGNIFGYVRNLRDGRVEVYAESEESQLKNLETALRKGPRSSEVSFVEVIEEMPTGKYSDFRITF
jgi:acylphosphatase